MQEANSSDKEKLERARRELASVAKIKQVCGWTLETKKVQFV